MPTPPLFKKYSGGMIEIEALPTKTVTSHFSTNGYMTDLWRQLMPTFKLVVPKHSK